MFCLSLYSHTLQNIKKLKYVPVGLGEENFSSQWFSDKTKKNISYKNRYYGEYTFHYWLWKNNIIKKSYELSYEKCRTMWYPSTNQCMNRKILNNFVDWYYPDYLQIKEQDLYSLSWYHERVFSVYIRINDLKVHILSGLGHFCKNSHQKGFNM